MKAGNANNTLQSAQNSAGIQTLLDVSRAVMVYRKGYMT